MGTKVIAIKITKTGRRFGPFRIEDHVGNVIADNVSLENLVYGQNYIVPSNVSFIVMTSLSDCSSTVTKSVRNMTIEEYDSTKITDTRTACVWTHLVDHTIYNSFYGVIEPYVIEYPFAYQYNDEILQSVESYDLVYKYFKSPLGRGVGESDRNNRVQTDEIWFNKAVLYDGQMSSGILELEPIQHGDMRARLSYPRYNSDSKVVGWKKDNNTYNYNTFWDVVKSKADPLFLTSCESLSVDKVVNQTNMDYDPRSFKKAPLRAKHLKVRHILDDKDDVTIVTQFIIADAQISY